MRVAQLMSLLRPLGGRAAVAVRPRNPICGGDQPWRATGERMKNPFMSMWLSNANRALGVGRGMVTAEMRRQQSAAAKEAMRAAGFGAAAKPKKKRPSKRQGS